MTFYQAIFLFLVSFWLLAFQPATGQTIQPPDITCTTTLPDGDVYINWNLPPDSCGPFIGYVVYGATNANGPFTVIDTIFNSQQTQFQHTGANATILSWFYFMVTLRDCPGFVSLPSDTVMEENLETPIINYVTVLPDGRVELNWQAGTSSQLYAYVVYYYLGGGIATIIDTLIGASNTTFIDVNANTSGSAFTYTVAAMDPCGNLTLFNNNPHNTIFVSGNKQACARSISLSWNPYQNFAGGVDHYEIQVSQDGDPYSMISSLPFSSLTYDLDLTYLTGDSICIRVVAFRGAGVYTSVSNVICFNRDFIRSTSYNYITHLDIESEDRIRLSWLVDTAADLTSFTIDRTLTNGTPLTMANLPATAPLPFLQTWYDQPVNTKEGPYSYQVKSSDLCDFELESTIGKTIFLEGKADLRGRNVLTWTPFELEHATVLFYEVLKKTADRYLSLDATSASEREYEDNVAARLDTDGSVCYYVRAEYSLNLPEGFNFVLSSRSNEVCVSQDPIIRVPNAFAPGGVNKQLVPTCAFCENSEYLFQIFARNGQKVFETRQPKTGWDGTYNGAELPLDGYAYVIRLTRPDGKVVEKKGTIVLVK